MATYPGAIPNLSSLIGTATDPLSAPDHAAEHAAEWAELQAALTELGVNPRSGFASVAAKLAASFQPRFRVGEYYTAPWGSGATLQLANGNMSAIPFFTDGARSFDRIGVEVVTAGSAGAVLRLGRYATGADGYPTTRIADDGTVDGTTTGGKEVTIAWTAPAAGMYWLACVSQGGAATQPIVRIVGNISYPFVGRASLTAGVGTGAVTLAGITGALPDPFGAGAASTGAGPAVMVRAAA